ncbi:amidophosphoribosyltransferase [Thermoflexus hugenholtzii]|jgi:amidophosphoribosyltransferase (EC 2.4.2.14)|uniref:Amidophosphoribosyltransferase n=1 Tax=Thermoflexus hugenholtzii JAD2 TaxID=877466 RepID=A0A212RK58_9CHLR|nr:amidophosphoribosyltransferase [Thermoflexus hugenholtzii]SNB72814.1 amidophosphoribosyltransferase [Thermoflexus hugenholtzii JAD2]
MRVPMARREADHPRESCGIVGLCSEGRPAAPLAMMALWALQHRGQESAGIATSDGRVAYLHKGMGLVSQVFHEGILRSLRGHLAIGHTRYSTTGVAHLQNAQPFLSETLLGPLGIAHNGNLVNALPLRRRLLERGVGLSSGSDSELILQILASPPEAWGFAAAVEPEGDPWVSRLRCLLRLSPGAYALVVLTREAIYAVRDPYGFRPLCLGEWEGGYAVASESCALSMIGARYVREIAPGEIVRLDPRGVTSFAGGVPSSPAFCIFEYVYFMRPDSEREGGTVYSARLALGRQLAREAPAEADLVIGVPDSATAHAIGYSLESGIPFVEGLLKNRYIGRTFIQPDDQARRWGVRLKYSPLREVLQGRRVVLVDDSVVRGHTTRQLVQLLREGGALEVHLRIASPPIRHPCFMGIDMATHEELIAHRLDEEGIRRFAGADSLAFLSLEGMRRAIRETMPVPEGGYCTACFSGRYPAPLPEEIRREPSPKLAFEGIRSVR